MDSHTNLAADVYKKITFCNIYIGLLDYFKVCYFFEISITNGLILCLEPDDVLLEFPPSTLQ
jgi:hypothetical protein